MILHYAELAAERRRRRCVPDRLGAEGAHARALGVGRLSGGEPARRRSPPTCKASSASDTIVTYGADWTEYGAHVVDASARRGALSARSAVGVAGRSTRSASTITRRCRTGATTPDHLDRAIASAIYDRDYLAGNLSGGEGFDWYYADAAARAAQTRTPITDGLGKPWMFRAKDLWSFWSNAASRARRRRRACLADGVGAAAKPIWLTEIGCPAVDKGANQPSVFPDPKSSESGYAVFLQWRGATT